VTAVLSRIDIETRPTDDDLAIERLTNELEIELTEVGEVHRPGLDPAPGDKGAGELALATLHFLGGVDLLQVEAMVRVLTGFVKRNDGRKVRVKIGDNEIAIDRASEENIERLVDAFVSAAERHQG
jgi:hypothetical protein